MKPLWKDRRHLLAAAVLLVLVAMLAMMGMPARELNLVKAYLWPLVFACVIAVLLYFTKKPCAVGFVSLALCGWFVVCTAANGDYDLQFNLRFIFGIWMSYGLCLTLMLVLDGQSREMWLNLFLVACGAIMLVISLLGFYAAFCGKQILLPFMEEAIGITQNRLYALGKHPNELGCLINMGMLCWLIAGMRSRKSGMMLLCLLALVPMAFAVGLTASRTSLLIAALIFGCAAMLAVMRLAQKAPVWTRWVAGGLALAVVAAAMLWVLNTGVVLAMNRQQTTGSLLLETALAENAKAESTDAQLVQRPFSENLSTFSARTEIWRAGLRHIKENPRLLLLGSTDGQVARIPGRYLGRDVYHVHNGLLEMLLQAGIPGLIMYLFLMGRMLLAAARQFFNQKLPSWQRMLAAAPVIMLINILMEIYPCVSGHVMDMVYMVLAGAVIGLDSRNKA